MSKRKEREAFECSEGEWCDRLRLATYDNKRYSKLPKKLVVIKFKTKWGTTGERKVCSACYSTYHKKIAIPHLHSCPECRKGFPCLNDHCSSENEHPFCVSCFLEIKDLPIEVLRKKCRLKKSVEVKDRFAFAA